MCCLSHKSLLSKCGSRYPIKPLFPHSSQVTIVPKFNTQSISVNNSRTLYNEFHLFFLISFMFNMKEGFQSIKIGPFTDHLEFIGLIKSSNPAAGSSLRGTLELSVQKTVKVKSMSLKFKGKSQATYTRPNDLQKFAITAKILPKLKTKIVEKSLTLHHGHHTFPWELDIPNVYPQTYSSDRCDISYYLELKIYLGVGRSVTVQHPITIHRHLVASPQSAALMNTKLYQYTSPDKFHYQIEAPKVICLDQEYFPLSIKYTCFNGSLLSHIRTFIVQTEVHR